MSGLKVAFHTNQICLQGTEIALYDYAHFNEELLGNESIVLARKNKLSDKGGAGKNQPLALEKFNERFKVFLYKDKREIEDILKKNEVDVFYAIKSGAFDGIEAKNCKNAIHAVFKYYQPHGEVYAYVSKWLSDIMTEGKAPYVDHMINLPNANQDLRSELRIPKDAIVFGRYGGTNSFDVPFVWHQIEDVAKKSKDVYFIFMNTDDFMNKSFWQKNFSKKTFENIIFLPGSSSMERKSAFINTCDAMLHARNRGETFGIAIGEFSGHNVPVLTFDGRKNTDFESNHLEILGDKGLFYSDETSLLEQIRYVRDNKKMIKDKDWDAYSKRYSPAVIMDKFNKVFLA
jgi:glycosyltransferase involved in cell wall biosynthesis